MTLRPTLLLFFAVVAFSTLMLGCTQKTPPAPHTFDDPAGPIIKTSGPADPGEAVVAGQGPATYYISNGVAIVPTAQDRRVGRGQLRVYNPMAVKNDVTITVYFNNRPPVELTKFTMQPNQNNYMVSIPKDFPGVFDGSEAWGARITGTAPLMTLFVLSAGVIAPKGDLWFGDPRYKGGNTGMSGTSTLSKTWFFSDGLVLQWDEQKPGQLFNEYEWYHVLNPNPRETTVTMKCNYVNGEADTFTFTVGAERVRIIDNQKLVRPNVAHSVKFISAEPVVVSAERYILDFAQTNDWGAWVHANHEGTPGEQLLGNPAK